MAADPLVISFDHRHSFEDLTTAFDGGVIEVSLDGGATWVDISTYAAPGYSGTLVLLLRQSAEWPARVRGTERVVSRRATPCR